MRFNYFARWDQSCAEADVLNRTPLVESLLSLFWSSGPATILLDGPTGSGKSFVMQMSAELWRGKDDHINNGSIIEFAAEHNRVSGRPVYDLTATAASQIQAPYGFWYSKFARRRARKAVRAAQYVHTNNEFANIRRSNKFRDAFFDLTYGCGKWRYSPSMFVCFIDGLDKCKPDYIIDTLHAVRYSFGNSSTKFVIAANKNNLIAALKNVQGENYNATGVLDDYFDVEIQMPTLTDDQRQTYLNYLYESFSLEECFDSRNPHSPGASLGLLARALKMNLRDMQKLVQTIYSPLSSMDVPEQIPEQKAFNIQFLWIETVVAMLILKEWDTSLYRAYIRGDATTTNVVRALIDSLEKPYPHEQAATIMDHVYAAFMLSARGKEELTDSNQGMGYANVFTPADSRYRSFDFDLLRSCVTKLGDHAPDIPHVAQILDLAKIVPYRSAERESLREASSLFTDINNPEETTS